MSLIVTGTVGIDTVEAPTGSREDVLGGSCVYFAAAASFFSPVRIVAAAGDDLPDEHRRVLDHFTGIDTRGLEVRAGSRTFRWGCRYLDDMNERETLYTSLGVLEEEPPTVPDAFRDSQYVFLANSHPAVQMNMLSQLHQPTLAVADTMDLWINIAREELISLLERIDGVILNDSEARLFTGKSNLRHAAEKIIEYGPAFVVVKKGEHGCIMVHRDGIAALPAYPSREVVDPTGAGDSFAGGMMGSIAAQDDHSLHAIQHGLACGTVVASFNIESFTLDRLKTLDKNQLQARLAKFAEMVRVN
ncbi:MAG: sugar kinase [Phycisphaerales bacterium]|nr:sugar kinase [Phycisphaerales bacterium]